MLCTKVLHDKFLHGRNELPNPPLKGDDDDEVGIRGMLRCFIL